MTNQLRLFIIDHGVLDVVIKSQELFINQFPLKFLYH